MNIIKYEKPVRKFSKPTPINYQIVLHHTESLNYAGDIRYWQTLKDTIATAYFILKNGDVVQVFDPKYYWAWHCGIGSRSHDSQSIGIEFVNEGFITKKNDKMFWGWSLNNYTGEVFDLKEPWRKQTSFAPYTPEQMKSAIELCGTLCDKFKIPRNIVGTFDLDRDKYKDFKGIVKHCNLNSKKTDISPAFNLEELANGVGGKLII
jgi:N-acetyl-anhydromuramyl-L-alanine amidase AmpD